MKIKITADSTCDLSEELLKKWDIALMPMHILMGEDSYLDGVTVHPADVFAYVNNGGKMPKSAAANLVEYTEFFAPFAKEYDAVIHISVSSKLSSCFQNARLAAGEFENVCVVDSQNICTGQGYLVLKAAKWAADGLTARAIQMKLQSLAKRVELSFAVGSFLLTAASVVLVVLGIALFFTPTPLGGAVFLFLAFLLSPFGLQAVADFLIEILDGGKNALYRFLAG